MSHDYANIHGFKQKLCGCTQDWLSCLVVAFVPCGSPVIHAVAVDDAKGDGKAVPFILDVLLCCVGQAINRSSIRKAYEIEGSFIEDCCLHFWCGACAVCQDYREVKDRKENKG